jgi:DNA-binding MarR family transcriptional regulator
VVGDLNVAAATHAHANRTAAKAVGATAAQVRARLQAMAFEIARISSDIDAPVPGKTPFQESAELRLAKQLIKERRARDQMFPANLFGEPAWDMLLDLFVAAGERRKVTVSNAAAAACVPSTTGQRYVNYMFDQALLVKYPDPVDTRRVLVALTPHAHEMTVNYLRGILSGRLADNDR